MADVAKDKEKPKKRKSEVKKSDLPKKSGDANSIDAKDKDANRKSSTTPDTAPPPGLKAQVEVEAVEEKPKAKKQKPILKAVVDVEVESEPAAPPKPSLKPVASVEVEVEESPKPRPVLKPVATVDVSEEDTVNVSVKPKLKIKPVATVEIEEDEEIPTAVIKPLKPVVSVEVEEEPSQTYRRASYVPPKAATKRDVELLYDLDEEKLMELREAFHLFDLNNDGFIDKEDLKNTYITLGKQDVDEDEIQHMLSEAINPLDFDAFVILLGYKSIELDPEEVLREALSQWDYDNSGMISEDRIKHDLMMWGDRFSQEEVELALEDAPVFVRENTAMIDYVKFCKALCGLRKKPKMPQPGDYIPDK